MKDYALIVRVPGEGLAANIEVLSADGTEPEGDVRRCAVAAIHGASEVAGGTPVVSDGDCYLDQEGPGGDLDLAVGVVEYERPPKASGDA